MSGVILTSGKFWYTLVAMRSLGRHGIKIACGKSHGSGMPSAFLSRYCSQHFSYPPFETQPEEFIVALCDFANSHKEFDVLMPTASETMIISKNIDYIKSHSPQLKIPLHTYDYINLANDKQKIFELASELRIPTPQTYYPHTAEEVLNIAKEIRYPVVIKIRLGSGGLGMNNVYSWQEMIRSYEETINKYLLDSNDFPFIQEYIPGTDYAAAALFNHGELKAKLVFKVLQSVPPSGGLMISRVSVRNEQMLGYLVALARAMHWHGIIMADFRLDERDNTPKLLDVNPRFWFSLYQGIASGVDFPYLLYRIAIDDDVESVDDYKTGIRTKYLWSYKNIPASLLLGNKLNGVEKTKEFTKTKFEDISFTDPLPNLATLFNAILNYARRARLAYQTN